MDTWTLIIIISLIICLLLIKSRKIRTYKIRTNNKLVTKNETFNIQENDILNPNTIFFKSNLPFTPYNKQIIYIENSYNSKVNEFINSHYERICSLLSEKGYYFCFLPYINRNIYTSEIIDYYNPNIKKEDIDILKQETNKLTYNDLLAYSIEKDNLHCGFLRYKGKEDSYYKFSYFEITEFTEQELWVQLHSYINQIGDATKLYSIGNPEKDEIADYKFSFESKKLVEEIKERIEKLRQIGINEMALKSIFNIEPKLSRLVITKDFKIFLPDYNNREIIMYPLPKAIFILFLKHPEGILFKQLPKFRNELKQIYSKLSTRAELNEINESIKNVTDPTNNAINEKCSRIREAFIKEFDESLAQYYFITGERAEPKKISLDRTLVTFESDF